MGKTLLLLLLLVVVVVVLQCIVLTMTRDYRGNLVIDYMHAVTHYRIQNCICDLCITEATLCVCVCVCVCVFVPWLALSSKAPPVQYSRYFPEDHVTSGEISILHWAI